MTPTPTPPEHWHLAAAQLRAYIDGALPQVQAWSTEAHLIGCAVCRDALNTRLTGDETAAVSGAAVSGAAVSGAAVSAAVHGPVNGILREVGARLEVLPEQVRVRRPWFGRRIWLIAGPRRPLFGPWLLSICLVLAGAVLLNHLAGPGFTGFIDAAPWAGRGPDGSAGWFGAGGSWVVLVAPLLPLLGIALAYGPGLDPGYELVAATSGGGFRLVLWRTAGVLAVALPVTALAELAGGGPVRVTPWLLPGLAITLATLALGTVLGLARAGTVLGVLWLAGTIAPVLIGAAPPLLTSVPAGAWPALAAGSALLVLARRHCFTQFELGTTTTEGWA